MSSLTFNLHTDEYISDYIRKYGCWEPITSEILLELWRAMEPGTIFVDIGANIGYFTIGAAQQGVPVIAFEPVAANYTLLAKSVQQSGFQHLVKTFMVPLSDTEERVTINICSHNMGLCSTRTLMEADHCYSQSSNTERLDKYFGLRTQNPLIVKIDVEEQEGKVLRGMKDTLSTGKVTHIILEIARYDKEIFDFLRQFGYVYVTNIGYAPDDKHSIDVDANHLRNAKYHSTLDQIEGEMMKSLNAYNPQRMLLLYRTPKPV